MKEKTVASKLRAKTSGNPEAKVYGLTREEALKIIKEHFIDPCSSCEQLDSLKLIPSFPWFKVPECTLDGWKYQHDLWPRSVIKRFETFFDDGVNAYTFYLPIFAGGKFNKEVVKMVEAKKAELSK